VYSLTRRSLRHHLRGVIQKTAIDRVVPYNRCWWRLRQWKEIGAACEASQSDMSTSAARWKWSAYWMARQREYLYRPSGLQNFFLSPRGDCQSRPTVASHEMTTAPTPHILAATNKSLAESNKSCTRAERLRSGQVGKQVLHDCVPWRATAMGFSTKPAVGTRMPHDRNRGKVK